MIQTSGFFTSPSPLPESDSSVLEQLSETADGHCVLLKGHRNDRVVVYKALKAEYRDDPVQQRMLRREYEIGISLKHPGICEVLAWTTLPQYGDSIEMEWIDGCRLDEWLSAHPDDTALQKKVLLDLCDALSYLHRKQVIHKDLKPENILITHYGNYTKVIDFGLSDTDSILTGKDPAGTRQYAAPEVVAGGMAVAQSDIFSLGRVMQGMDPVFAGIARKCTRMDQTTRYASAEEVRRDLERIGRMRPWRILVPLGLLAAAILLALLLLRGDPAEKLFLDAVEQVRQAAMPS